MVVRRTVDVGDLIEVVGDGFALYLGAQADPRSWQASRTLHWMLFGDELDYIVTSSTELNESSQIRLIVRLNHESRLLV